MHSTSNRAAKSSTMDSCDNCGIMLDPALAVYTYDLPQHVPVCGIACHVLTGLKFMPKRTRGAGLLELLRCDDEVMSDIDD